MSTVIDRNSRTFLSLTRVVYNFLVSGIVWIFFPFLNRREIKINDNEFPKKFKYQIAFSYLNLFSNFWFQGCRDTELYGVVQFPPESTRLRVSGKRRH